MRGRRLGSGGRSLTARQRPLARCKARFLIIGDLCYRLSPPSPVALEVLSKDFRFVTVVDKRNSCEITIPGNEIVELVQ